MAPTNLFSIISVFGSHFIVPGTCLPSKMQAVCIEHLFGGLQLLYLPLYNGTAYDISVNNWFQRFASVNVKCTVLRDTVGMIH